MSAPIRSSQPVATAFPAYRPGSATSGSSVVERLRSIDIVRGAVMVLMALDHVRVFSGVPAGGPPPPPFLTPWVTNFLAPDFLFLAGTAPDPYPRQVGN